MDIDLESSQWNVVTYKNKNYNLHGPFMKEILAHVCMILLCPNNF